MGWSLRGRPAVVSTKSLVPQICISECGLRFSPPFGFLARRFEGLGRRIFWANLIFRDVCYFQDELIMEMAQVMLDEKCSA
mmetsp:Transcript_884/g.1720  ORF Transcript_884/g.1720 Transcript_884/m.1720 type:complete len:81 (-) Transcript_884:629-871(-)